MTDITTAFWGMTINNYDATDLALVRQGYPDYIRQLVYTLEKGEEGTPHIQAYVKLFRQQRLSYVKKLFPRGSFKALLVDEYKLNAQRYAQKLDITAESPAVITNNPFPDAIVELTDVMRSAMSNFHSSDNPHEWLKTKDKDVFWFMEQEEFHRVVGKPALSKFYVSSVYVKVKKQFLRALLKNVVDTHTHTHKENLFSHDSINADRQEGDDSQGRSDSQEHSEEEDCYDFEESERSSDEGHEQSADSSTC